MKFESPRKTPNSDSRAAKRRSKKRIARNRNKQTEYQQLEARNLLAVEVGLNFTSGTLGTDSSAVTPNVSGAVGPDHVVQVVADGYAVFNKTDGSTITSSTIDEFWADAGVTGETTQDPRVLFDPYEDRFFVSSLTSTAGNSVLVAVSNSSDPADGWSSVQFQADEFGIVNSVESTFSLDADGVYVTTTNSNGTISLFTIPKRDLLGATPSVTRMTRFEDLSTNDHGDLVQISFDFQPNARGIGLGAIEGGALEIIRTDIVGPSGPGAGLSTPTSIPVPFYQDAPDARQPSGVPIGVDGPTFDSNIIRTNGSIWAAHTTESALGTAEIRWYQIDDSTNAILNSGSITDADLDFYEPAINVNEFGVITIAFTMSGPDMFASVGAVTGFTTNGLETPTVEFGEVEVVREGLADYDNGFGNPWGTTSAVAVDPTDPFSFWSFQQFANTGDNWSTRVSELGLFDVTPTVRADGNANEILIRTSPTNADWVEIQIDGDTTDIFERRSLTGLNIDAGAGNDSVIIDLSFGEPLPFSGITVRGDDGFDTFEISGATTGQNWLVDGDGSGNVDGDYRFLNFEELIGSQQDDSFEIQATDTDLIIKAGGGNDTLFVTGAIGGALTLMGEQGDDVYRLPIESITSITVIDSNNSEDDLLEAFATTNDDVITLDDSTIQLNGATTADFIVSGVENLLLDGLNGDDQFNIQGTNLPATFIGGVGNDEFIFSSDGPATTGTSDDLGSTINIDGGAGQNSLIATAFGSSGKNVVVNDGLITGIGSSDINYTATDGNFAGGIRLIGSDTGSDTFIVESLSVFDNLMAEGSGGIDRFVVRAGVQGDVHLDGQHDGDTYQVSMQNQTIKTVTVGDTGTSGTDRIVLAVTENADTFNIFGDVVTIVNERLVTDGQTESLVINSMGGNDFVTIGNNNVDFVRLITGLGNDEIQVDGSNGILGLNFETGDGADSVHVNRTVSSTFTKVSAGDGNDLIDVRSLAWGNGRIDGQDGADDVVVDFVGRTNRVINARDTGASGDDSLLVTGTGGIDRYVLRGRSLANLSERILFDQNTESLNANPGHGNDFITVFGSTSPDTVINTGEGDDSITVNSTSGATSLVINSGIGNDRFTVKRTAASTDLRLNGDIGNETFQIGSSIANDNGNLGQIRGRVTVSGEASSIEDRLLVNDRGATAPYDYFVSDSQIVNSSDDGSPSRDNFAGIFFNTVEFVRLDGTDKANDFTVQPSMDTRFFIDGNLPEDTSTGDRLTVTGNANADGRTLSSNGQGDGVWKFSNGQMDVRFESIELGINSRQGRSLLSQSIVDSSQPRSINSDDLALLAGSVALDEVTFDVPQSSDSIVDDAFASEEFDFDLA